MQVGMRQWLCAGLAALALGFTVPATAADAGAEQDQAARQQSQPGNNAPVWRDVRGGDNKYQTTQVRGVESSVLMQPEGETWAKEHHEYWYRDEIAQQKSGGGATNPAAASAMKEGWKQ